MSHDELPAILGGSPVRPEGPPEWPGPNPEVSAAVARAAADGSWGRYDGAHSERLRERLCEHFGAGHAVLCGSGTFAVELALRALRIGPGDEVILASYDYPGNFLCVHAVGAVPVLVDVAANTWNLSLDAVCEGAGPKTRAVLASHLHGGLVPMRELTAWATERQIAVIEDAAQVPGAIVQGRPAGTWGEAGVLSFGGSKLLSAGRGGALLTSHADVAQRARTCQWRGNVVCPLSELQAVALLPQLDRLEERNQQRARAALALIERLRDIPGIEPARSALDGSFPAYYKLGFQFDAAVFGLARDRLVAAMRAEGIALSEGFRAAHVGRSTRRFRRGSDLSESERAHEGAVILHHPVLLGTEAELEQVVRGWWKVYRHAKAVAG